MATWHMLSRGTRGFFIFFLSRHLSFSSSPPPLPFVFFAAFCEHGRRKAWSFSICPCLSLLSRVLVSFRFSRLFYFMFFLFSL